MVLQALLRIPGRSIFFCSIAALIVTMVTSLGNDNELVHPICIKRENQSTNKTTQTTKPPPQKAKKKPNNTNQNTGNPMKVKVRRPQLSEHLLRQIVPLNTRMHCSPHSNVFQSSMPLYWHGGHPFVLFWWLCLPYVRQVLWLLCM